MLGPIRLFLAALVVLSHTAGYPHERWPDPGLPAVIAFFMISGYLMPAAFERNYADTSFARRTWRYALNRALRIFPAYWIVLAVAVYLDATAGDWKFDYARDHPQAFAQNVFLLGLNQAEIWGQELRFVGPAWTLDIELQYYAVVPVLVFAHRRWPQPTIAGMLALTVLSLVLAANPVGVEGIDKSVIVWFPLFAVGFVCYVSRFSFAGWLARPEGHLLAFLGLLSYPLYLVHHPLMRAEVGGALAGLISQDGHFEVVFFGGLGTSLLAAVALHCAIEPAVDHWRRRNKSAPTDTRTL